MNLDFTENPLVVGRAASLPFRVATELLGAADPLEETRTYLRENTFARAAIEVASPSLSAAIDDWLADKPLRNHKTPLRALAYLVRMATRTTPFGLFAGIGGIDTGETTTLRLAPEKYVTRTRPDMAIIEQGASLTSDSCARSKMRIVTNDSAFVRGNRLHVTNIALTNHTGSGAQQRDVSLRHTKAVAFVRDFCANGATYAATAEALCKAFSAERADAERLIDRLQEAGVVLSELKPSPIGDPIAHVVARLDEMGAAPAAAMRSALAACAAHDTVAPYEQTAEQYARLRQTAASIVESPPKDVLQVDLRAGFSGTLGTAVLSDAAVLAQLAMRSSAPPRLDDYRRRFVERYEGTERLVPLLELVDNELGLGFPEAPKRETRDDEARTTALMQIFSEAMRDGSEEIDLRDGIIGTILPATESGRMPTALEVGFYIEAVSAQAVSRGEYRLIGGMLFERACGTIGRFGELLGPDAIERMRAFARRTQRGEVVAELAYAPASSRRYNVCVRPRIYDYEVRAGVGTPPGAGSLSPADLYVGIEDDRFFLWSKSLASRVDVRETHAMTTIASAPNLCRFLALVYKDNMRVPDLNLGPAENLTYLPRITHGRVVVGARRWRFARSAFGGTVVEIARALDSARERWGLPRYVYLVDGDNRLLMDLDSRITPAMLGDHASGNIVRFTEVLPAPDRVWVAGRSGNHAVEFVAEALVVSSDSHSSAVHTAPVLVENRAVHGPGSQWCYAKLYMGSQNADDFIVRQLAPLVATLRDEGLIDSWFFLRYTDPGFHVRIRAHAPNDELAAAMRELVLSRAQMWLRESLISRLALDTYDPEYERYGGIEEIGSAEAFFHYDSGLCMSLLAEGIADTGARIEMAASTLDASIRASRVAAPLVLDMYAAAAANRKLEPRDREALRRIAVEPPLCKPYDLDAALAGEHPARRLGAFVHMHCNRLGLDSEAEVRVCILLRSLCLSRKARHVAIAGSSRG